MHSRRQFIVAFVATGATAMMTAASSYADPTSVAAMKKPDFLIVVDEARTLSVISGDYTTRATVPFTLSQTMQIKNPQQFRVMVQFDGRIFAAGEIGVLSHLEKYEMAPTVITLADAPAFSSVAYDVPDIFDGASEASATISFPLTVVDRYPQEGLDTPLPLVLTILDGDGSELARAEWLAEDTQVPVSAWGAEVMAVWSDTGVVDGAKTTADKYRYPSAIRCVSTGPHPMPAGSTLAIELDGMVFESCGIDRIIPLAPTASPAAGTAPVDSDAVVVSPSTQAPWTGASYLVGTEKKDGLLRTTITLNQEVPAGEAIEVTLVASEKPGSPIITSVTYASAFLAGPVGDKYWQRTTGKYLVTDLTGSGTPRVTDVAKGEI